MSYTETVCQLCAVPFCIKRLPTAGEPKLAWTSPNANLITGEPDQIHCIMHKEQTGCMNAWTYATEYAHVPGRGCTCETGYNGWKIGAEEMKDMNHPRYIVKRPSNLEPDDQSAEYERKSDYFLTTKTETSPTHSSSGFLESVRYDLTDVCLQNYPVSDIGNEVIGIPVHDACWKIFERVCELRLGEVDLQGFMALWQRQACGNCGFQTLKQEPIIMDLKHKDSWRHLLGTEYLGANPFEIPGFLLGLLGRYSSSPFGDGVFPNHQPGVGISPLIIKNPTDPFTKFPAEIKNMILSHLESKDVARLRLASRSFRQLPKQLFGRLIKDELPWFWELDELRKMDDAHLREVYKNRKLCNPEQAERFWRIKSRKENVTQDVNWMRVYQQLCILKKSVLGVRNRARVWYLAEEVVLRIADLRDRLTDQFGGVFPVEPTADEVDMGMVKSDSFCPRCQVFQIERD